MQNNHFKINDKVWVKPLKQAGKIYTFNRDMKTVKVEIIVNFNKETSERTTKLETVNLSDLVKYREKRTRKNPKKDKLFWAKVKPNAIIPTKRLEDGCYDIYACVDQDEIVIEPHEIVEIPTGIASAFSHKYRLDFQRERGSTGSIGLVPRCGQIDSGYRGEIFLKMQNVTNKTIIISKTAKVKVEVDNQIFYPMNKAICQAALEIVPKVEEKEISYEELLKIPSERGTGKLGSSGK